MEKMKVYYDPLGNTLHIWFGDPRDEYITEEADEELGLVKNKAGEIIGIEKLNFFRQGSVRSPWIACRIAIRSWALSSIRDAMNGLRP